MDTAAVGARVGLRERKKRATREAIRSAAMKLFAAHGFDAVPVADVARAAGVSEKTVFNYFPAKEDLVFAGGLERRAALVDAVRALAPGVSIVEPFRALTDEFLASIERGPAEDVLAVPRIVRGSAMLRGRLLVVWEQEAAVVTPAVAAAAGRPEDDLQAAVVSRSLTWTHRVVFRAAAARLLAGEEPSAVARALRAQARAAYDLLEGGLAGFRAPQ